MLLNQRRQDLNTVTRRSHLYPLRRSLTKIFFEAAVLVALLVVYNFWLLILLGIFLHQFLVEVKHWQRHVVPKLRGVPKTMAYFLKQHERVLKFAIFVAGKAHVKKNLNRALPSHIWNMLMWVRHWRLDKILNPSLLGSILDILSCNL